ncbi:MAG: cytochrome c peroxidase [Gammaproteobacteria bacterium]
MGRNALRRARSGVAVLCCLLGPQASSFAHGQEDETPQIAAPGYGELNFTPAAAGSYRLPPVATAADGEVLLADGKPTRLYDLLDGRVVFLSFIYTQCNDINGCPLATVVLKRTLQRLEQFPELKDNVRFISLSFDPEHDTPAALADYSAPIVRGLDGWLFATTANADQLQPILEGYGQNVIRVHDADDRPTGTISHTLRVFLIDRNKRIRNVYSAAFLHPDVLLNDAKTLLMEESGGAGVGNTRTPARSARLGPGDDKTGYEAANYRTHSTDLRNRAGQPADLLANALQPPLGLPALPVPADNPLSAAKIELGRKLFYDRRLSFNNTLSCAICHIPEQGFANNELATAVGIEGRTVRRNAPTLYNVGYLQRLFHDGRETRLEQQVWQPLLMSNEMANPSMGAVLEKLQRIPEYAGLFEAAFGGRGPTVETVGMALASYERVLNAADSPFDRWYFAKQDTALDASAQRGYALFSGKAGCAACHRIDKDFALFTDQRFHNTGVGWFATMRKDAPKRKVQLAPGVFVEVETAVLEATGEKPPNDLGLYEISQDPADRWRYRTPSLRNVALTAPYMHDGSLATLEAVVAFYNQGGYAHDLLDPLLKPLQLGAGEQGDLVAFLKALTGSNVEALVADAFAAPVGDLRAADPHWSHANRVEY